MTTTFDPTDRRPAIVRFVDHCRHAASEDQSGPLAAPGRVGEVQFRQLTVAAARARAAYPGLVGELLRREILAYRDFGYGFDRTALIPRITREILATAPAPNGATFPRPATPAARR